MDILTNKSKKSTDYLSRYSTFNYYYNTLDNKYIYGLTNQLKDDAPFVEVSVNMTTTLDSLADKYYGRPDYYWIIADFNKISDPFINLYENFKIIKVPSLTAIEYRD